MSEFKFERSWRVQLSGFDAVCLFFLTIAVVVAFVEAATGDEPFWRLLRLFNVLAFGVILRGLFVSKGRRDV